MDKTDYEAKLAIEVQKLNEYREALRQEHEQIIKESSDGAPLIDGDVVAANVDQKMLAAADDAAEVVVEILVHGDKDTTRLAAARYILDNVKGKTTPEGDPWDKILSRIAKEPVANEE